MKDSRVSQPARADKSARDLSGALFAEYRLMLTSALNIRVGAARQVKANNRRDQRHPCERSVCGTRAEFQLPPPNCSADELRSVIARNVMVWIGSGTPNSVGTSTHETL